MNSITQDVLYKQSVVKYSYRNGVTKAAIKFEMHRKTIYRWREKYDGTAESLTKEVKEKDGRYYQYTAIDEYTRQRVLWASKEHSTNASSEFIDIVKRKFKYEIECIQTDNGFEFTNRLQAYGKSKKTMFENKMEK